MKKFIAKTTFVSLFCFLLAVLMLLSGCNSGSSATNIFESVKEANELQKYDFEMNIETEISGQTSAVKIEGTYNNAESMMASATITSGGMTLEISDIILDGDRVYLNVSNLLSLLGSSESLDGKDYIYFDISEMESIAGTSAVNMQDLGAYENLSKTITDKLYDVLEKATEGVEPAVLGKDGDKFTFEVNKDNITDYVSNIISVLSDEQDWILNTLPDELNNAGLSDFADMITDNKDDISDALENAVEKSKENPDTQITDNKDFEVSAYSSMTMEDRKIWNMGIFVSMNTSSNDDTNQSLSDLESGVYSFGRSVIIDLDMVISENTEDKPITKVDENNAINYMDYVSAVDNMYEVDEDAINQYMNIENGYYTLATLSMEDSSISPEDLADTGFDVSDYYINIKSMGIGEICLSGTTSELIFTDKEMLIDGEIVEYTYAEDTITIEHNGSVMAFTYNESFVQ